MGVEVAQEDEPVIGMPEPPFLRQVAVKVKVKGTTGSVDAQCQLERAEPLPLHPEGPWQAVDPHW